MKKLELLSHQHIFALGQGPVPSVHASTLTIAPDGTLCAAWFGGENESRPDVRIWFSRRNAAGRWSFPEALSDDNSVPDWNPALFTCGKKLMIFYKEGTSPKTWWTLYRESTDSGATWSDIRELVPGDVGGRGPVKDKPIALSDGALLAGASIEDPSDRGWHAFTDRSEDGGLTWTASAPVAIRLPGSDAVYPTLCDLPAGTGGLIQPTVFEHPAHDGRVGLFARSSLGWIYRADSADYGRTWSVAAPSALPNNNSGIDACMTASGTLALIYNPVGKNWGQRSPLNVDLSDDFGGSFIPGVVLENVPGEFSYPAIISDRDRLYATYTWNRKTVAFAEMKLTEC